MTDPKQVVLPNVTSARKVAGASMIGTTIEYYDFFLYGTAAALVFNTQFFPSDNPAVGTLAAFAAFAVGFLARPLGGVIFGHMGDRVGRKSTLIATLTIMGVASTLIGLLPTYATIGVWAPILLVVLRVLQGLGLGGEGGGAVLMSVEHAPEGSKNKFAGFTQMGTPFGLFLANVAFLLTIALVGVTGFVDWAWRIPFLLSALLVAVGLFIRVSVGESPSFAAAKGERELIKLPVVGAIKGYWRGILFAIFTITANAIAAYVFLVFGISYGTSTLKLDRQLLLFCVSGASLIWLATIPFWTRRADSNGRRKIFVAGSLALLIASAVFFPLLDVASTGTTILAYAILGLIVPVTHSIQGIIIADIFPAEMRYSGFGLTLGGSTILAGLAPLVAASLMAATGTTLSITIFMVVVCAVSTVSALGLFRYVPDTDRGHRDHLPVAA